MNTTTALYRKYRPSGFEEVIGQEHVVTTIQNAVASGSFSHAYLFTGPRGTGKTTMARLLAKAVNCENPKKGAPCGSCANCLAIASGRALDIIEIDAASNRGIDEIRELREGIRMSPAQLKYKVYIVDEAHQLTKEAFNALLKTLEEPPAHAIFVLATTSVDKMPETILSRVQRFDFKKFTVDQIAEKLKKITASEKRKADDDAIRMIAHAAQGGLRDAESMFAQVLAFAKGDITKETSEAVLGIVGFARVADLTDLIAAKDVRGVIVFVNEFHNRGGNAETLLQSLSDYLRKVMLIRLDAGLAEAVAPELTKEQLSRMMAHGKTFGDGEVERAMEALLEAQAMTKKTPLPTLPLELAFIKLLAK